MNDTMEKQERLLAVAAQKKQLDEADAKESLDELEELIVTAGGITLAKILQKVETIHSGHYIGSGKIQEIQQMIEELDATGVVFDDELSPVQMRNLANELSVKVMDRTMIILDIFASRAQSREGKIQVEMAQLKYQNSRLIGFGEMLSRQGGGIGSRGPGEKKLELDKRHIRTRMEILKKELEEISKHRALIRARRDKKNTPVVAIVGYTNAGKSTLLNALSGSDVYVQNELFATLDPTTRGVTLPGGTPVLVSDTVGFIRKLPHHLIKAFHSTLEEAKYADIILHVMDSSSSHLLSHQQVVYDTLQKLGIEGIPMIAIYNKEDKQSMPYPKDEKADYALAISAKNQTGIEDLLLLIEQVLLKDKKAFTIQLDFTKQDIVAFCHNHAERLTEEYTNEGILLKGVIAPDKFYKIAPYLYENNAE